MLSQQLLATAADMHVQLAAADDITKKTSSIGKAVLAATVVFAVVAAFFTQAQRKWMVVVTILLIGSFTFMIVDDPKTLLSEGGDFIKTNIWDPILNP
ncbi:TcpD family membrane protein [Streptomyces sp. NBC_01275]|uniref:TcpD family membrane protein n=1 Tax=Streptomyces sp. NBC_01275 TaxID=2903807 RepID=UPI00224E6DB2|nr:TcpD family membrane protein [Streptomyces sp. NBC_01275]MCX4763804.1 TcpD family membrane protein [Streptomyces sp. NBC_01275]